MRFLRKKYIPLILFVIMLYSCGSSSPTLSEADIKQPTRVSLTASSLPDTLKASQFLLRDINSQQYYISNNQGHEKTPLDIPANIRGIDLSPDGQTIAYIISNESPAIALLSIENGVTTELHVSSDIAPGIGLSWSPDNQSLVFSCRIQGTLGLSLCLADRSNKGQIEILVKSETLNVLDMLDGAITPSWSNHESLIIFISTKSSPSSGTKSTSARDIWLFDISTRSASKLFSDNTYNISYIFTPVMLPDGKSIIFSGRREQFNTIFLYEIDSQTIKDITSTGNQFNLVDFILNPDSNAMIVHVPSPSDTGQFTPTIYSLDGILQMELDFLKNSQVISWIDGR